MNKVANKIRGFIRKSLRIKECETISDGIERNYYHLIKKFPHAHIQLDELEKCFNELQIKSGEVLIVHASWRALYMLDTTPNKVLDLLIKKLGEEGTLLMPCYGNSSQYFDVANTKSAAGVLSECLRMRPETQRSVFPKFSMCGCGKYIEEILSEHAKSSYQFDQFSPYSIAVKKYNAKILLLGLGKNPHKITVFHCASYDSKEYVKYYNECYSKKCEAIVVDNSIENKIDYVDRMPNYNNDKKTFRKLFRIVNKTSMKKKGAHFILFEGLEAYNKALAFCLNGGKIYTKR